MGRTLLTMQPGKDSFPKKRGRRKKQVIEKGYCSRCQGGLIEGWTWEPLEPGEKPDKILVKPTLLTPRKRGDKRSYRVGKYSRYHMRYCPRLLMSKGNYEDSLFLHHRNDLLCPSVRKIASRGWPGAADEGWREWHKELSETTLDDGSGNHNPANEEDEEYTNGYLDWMSHHRGASVLSEMQWLGHGEDLEYEIANLFFKHRNPISKIVETLRIDKVSDAPYQWVDRKVRKLENKIRKLFKEVHLLDQQREDLGLRYIERMTQEEIALKRGVRQQSVSDVLEAAQRRVKRYYDLDKEIDVAWRDEWFLTPCGWHWYRIRLTSKRISEYDFKQRINTERTLFVTNKYDKWHNQYAFEFETDKRHVPGQTPKVYTRWGYHFPRLKKRIQNIRNQYRKEAPVPSEWAMNVERLSQEELQALIPEVQPRWGIEVIRMRDPEIRPYSYEAKGSYYDYQDIEERDGLDQIIEGDYDQVHKLRVVREALELIKDLQRAEPDVAPKKIQHRVLELLADDEDLTLSTVKKWFRDLREVARTGIEFERLDYTFPTHPQTPNEYTDEKGGRVLEIVEAGMDVPGGSLGMHYKNKNLGRSWLFYPPYRRQGSVYGNKSIPKLPHTHPSHWASFERVKAREQCLKNLNTVKHNPECCPVCWYRHKHGDSKRKMQLPCKVSD
jgi:predicted DNA-binding protein (UPF0251 family)